MTWRGNAHLNARDLHYHARRSLLLTERAKVPHQRIAEKAAAVFALNETLRGLPFERHGFGVSAPDDWQRLYSGPASFGYFRDFGWRAAFRGGGE